MGLLEALGVWLSGYISVFLLGFQSRNAIAARYGICAATSFILAFAQVGMWHAAATTNPWVVAFLVGTSGAAGICSAIFFNTRVMGHKKT